MSKRVVAGIIFLVLFGGLARAGGLPVIDLTNIAQIVDQIKNVKEFWENLNGGEGLMNKFIGKFGKMINASELTGLALGGEQLQMIDAIDIQKYLDGSFFRDIEGVDIWKDVLSSQTKLVQKYQGLEYQNVNFREDQQADPELVEYMEENLLIEKEMVQNMQNMADFIASMRKWELERAEKLKQYSDLIKKFAQGNGQYGEASNLEAVGNAIKIEILKADQQLLAVNRVMMESELKEKVVKIDMEKRYQQMKDSIQVRNQIQETESEE